jgi:DNA repair protein RadC
MSPSISTHQVAFGSQATLDLALVPAYAAAQRRPLLAEERVSALGASALSDLELVALVVGSVSREDQGFLLAERLLAEAGSVQRLLGWTEADFRRLRGIGPAKAWQMVAAFELARRAFCPPCAEAPLLSRADMVAAYLQPFVAGLEVEKFWALLLNRKNRLIRRVEVSSGSATSTLAHPREVFRAAIKDSACALVVAHNHGSSGDPAPSSADIQITRLLKEASRTV